MANESVDIQRIVDEAFVELVDELEKILKGPLFETWRKRMSVKDKTEVISRIRYLISFLKSCK